MEGLGNLHTFSIQIRLSFSHLPKLFFYFTEHWKYKITLPTCKNLVIDHIYLVFLSSNNLEGFEWLVIFGFNWNCSEKIKK